MSRAIASTTSRSHSSPRQAGKFTTNAWRDSRPTGARENADAPRPWWWDAAATATRAEYVDIRDDRIYRHFSLKPRERITFVTRFNAAYRGRYYLPGVAVEAMYDASRYARSKGQWVEVVEQTAQ